jgi:hypothetical protein
MLVTNHTKATLDFGSGTTAMSLEPGNNEISDTLWGYWVRGPGKCAGLDWHIEKGLVEARESVDFPALDDEKAIALVAETCNLELLRTWSQAEKAEGNRVAVLAAIGEQVESFE